MRRFKIRLCVIPLLLLLGTSSCAVPTFEIDSAASTRAALSRGDIKQALASYESQARDAEKNAAASFFSQYYWKTATQAYVQASGAARLGGQLQKSISYGQRALETAGKTKKPNLQVEAIASLVAAYGSVRNYDRAEELIERGLMIIKELPANVSERNHKEGILYYLLGHHLLRRREFDKAIDSFFRSIYLQRVHLSMLSRWYSFRHPWIYSGRHTLIMRLTALGDAYRAAGKTQQALEQYQSALNYIKVWGLKYAFEHQLYLSIGELHRIDKDFGEALQNFEKALSLALGQGGSGSITSASVRIGDIFLETGKPAEAIPYYQKAIQQIESTRSLLQSEAFRQSYFEGGLDAYVSMIGVLSESGRAEEAFGYSERARSRAFLDLVGSKAQLSRLKGGLLEEERTLHERIAAIRARLFGEEDDERDKSGLTKELSTAEQAYNAFLAKVRSQDKEQASLMSVEPLTLKQVQELLDPGQTLIEYFVTDNEVFVWVVEKDKLNFQRVAVSKTELAKAVKNLRDNIASIGDSRELREVSTSLYRQLVEPVVSQIAGKELIIVPHDVLHYLPFQALQSDDGRYLVEKYSISYLSSASLLQFTKEKRRAQGEKVLALGNPDLGDPKMSLQFAEVEAKGIRNLYPQSTLLLNKEATEEKAKTLAPSNDIIHFASHAELSEDDPLASAILLAKSDKEDGRLEVREIFGMDLKASLVVLSACETGLGKLSSGDELVGLTRAFIYAGTPSVVASLWNVEDSSTAQLMASFYKNLKTMTKVEALRQAQLNLIRGNVNSDLLARRGIGGVGKLGEVPAAKSPSQDSVAISTSHPFFWAPFILVGEGK